MKVWNALLLPVLLTACNFNVQPGPVADVLPQYKQPLPADWLQHHYLPVTTELIGRRHDPIDQLHVVMYSRDELLCVRDVARLTCVTANASGDGFLEGLESLKAAAAALGANGIILGEKEPDRLTATAVRAL